MPRKFDRNLWIWLAPVALTLVLFGVLIMVLSANAAPIRATNTITVTNTNDSGAGSLRQAIADAVSGDTIAFSAVLSGGTIVLAAPLTITKDLTIDGAGLADPLRISGSNALRVFYIPSGNVTMAHLVVQEGHAAGATDCTTVNNGGSCGGGIYAANPLILNHMTVLSNTAAGTGSYPGAGGALYLGRGGTLVDVFARGNAALGSFAGNGGGIASFGPLTIVNSTITDNWAEGAELGGGGIVVSGGSAIISGTTISKNRSTTDDGGGITMDYHTREAITVTNSIIQGNYAADDGGGLKLDNTVARLDNTHIVSNEAAADGGAMHIDYAAAVTLVAATMTENHAGDDGGAIYKQDSEAIVISNTQLISNTAINRGGGLYNQTGNTVAISDSVFISNTAGAAGGAINNNIATMTIDHSVFANNTSLNADGGAVANNGDGTLIVSISTFTGNAAPSPGRDGGAIYNGDDTTDTLIVDSSTFNGNRADEGGAVRSRDILILTNSTFYNNAITNASGGGGALRLMGTANITNSTIFSNSAPGNAGGVRISSDTGDFSFANVIVTDNSGGQCSTAGGVFSGVNNLATDATCGAGFAQVSDGLLDVLGNYGGATQTAPLLPGSPALDAGDNTTCLLRDQRGVARPQGSTCDIGAFESQGFVLNKAGGDNQVAVIGQPFALPLVITVTSQSWQGFVEAVNGGMIEFSAPIAGASVTFAPTTTQPVAAGSVVLPITANTALGSYKVTAVAAGAVTQTFSLTNTEVPPPQLFMPQVYRYDTHESSQILPKE